MRRTAANGAKDEVDLLLLRKENEVTGGYSNKTVDGFIEGKIVNGALHFTWREGKLNGRGVVEGHGETLHGTWGDGEAEQDGGKFNGERVRRKKESTPQ